MKRFLLQGFCVLALSGLACCEELGVAKVYRGSEGLEVTVLRYGARDKQQSLVEFRGVDSPWNGQVFLADVKETDRSIDYLLEVDGREWRCIVGRSAWNEWSYQAYVRGIRRDFRLVYDKELSRQVDPEKLASRFREQSARP